jgi:hypothetical protein
MRDTAFIAVITARTRGGVWLRHFNDGAKLIQEAGVIGAFRLRGAGPTGDEGFNFRQRWRAWHVLGECNEVRLLGKGQLRRMAKAGPAPHHAPLKECQAMSTVSLPEIREAEAPPAIGRFMLR